MYGPYIDKVNENVYSIPPCMLMCLALIVSLFSPFHVQYYDRAAHESYLLVVRIRCQLDPKWLPVDVDRFFCDQLNKVSGWVSWKSSR